MHSTSPHIVASTAPLHGWLYYTFDPPNWGKAVLFAASWVVMLGALYVIFIWSRKHTDRKKWTTQDIFILAILAVLLLAWDSFLNDQLIGPLVTAVPVAGNFLNWIQLPDFPYMFIVMVAVATIRKPGVVTSLIFIETVLGQILFASHGVNVPDWVDALDQGVFADLYLLARGDRALSDMKAMLIDGFVIGFLRGGPNYVITAFCLDPFLNATIHTWGTIIGTNLATGGGFVGNALGNGIEAAVVAPLAVHVARSIGVLSYRQGGARRAATGAVPAMSGAGAAAGADPPDGSSAGASMDQSTGELTT